MGPCPCSPRARSAPANSRRLKLCGAVAVALGLQAQAPDFINAAKHLLQTGCWAAVDAAARALPPARNCACGGHAAPARANLGSTGLNFPPVPASEPRHLQVSLPRGSPSLWFPVTLPPPPPPVTISPGGAAPGIDRCAPLRGRPWPSLRGHCTPCISLCVSANLSSAVPCDAMYAACHPASSRRPIAIHLGARYPRRGGLAATFRPFFAAEPIIL